MVLDFSAFGELVETVNESNKPAPVSGNPDRQFYQSGVTGPDRQFEPEALPKRGERGTDVSNMQKALVDAGVTSIKKVDGAFGINTEKGVQEFQKMRGLPETGIFDEATRSALFDSAATPSGSHTVVSGDSLSKIARDNGTTVEAIMAANPDITNPNMISVGQEINLGEAEADTTRMPDSDKPKIASPEPVKVQAVEEATTPQEVTEVVTESTPEIAADNPLEYIFNKGFVGLDEKNPEHQGTIAGFLNNAVPNFVTDNSQVTKGSKAWCGAFADHVLDNLGFDRLETGDRYDKLRAKQYLGYGDQVDGVNSAKAGDLVVIKGPTGWHVSFFVGKDKNGKVLALGGNQGNSVKVSSYSENSVRGVRRISNVGDMDVNMLKNISSDIAENSGEESTR